MNYTTPQERVRTDRQEKKKTYEEENKAVQGQTVAGNSGASTATSKVKEVKMRNRTTKELACSSPAGELTAVFSNHYLSVIKMQSILVLQLITFSKIQ
jgi:hypothetical protein